MNDNNTPSKDSLLLNKFNSRDRNAFGEVYLLYYDELFYFASKLYKNTEVASDDIIQDVFAALWEIKSQKFDSLINIKAYLFISVKNNFKNYLRHRSHIDKFNYYSLLDNNKFITYIAETEIFSLLSEAVNLLPEETGKVFQSYLNGLDTKEIATKFKKAESTIYNQRKEAINILRRKFSTDKMMIILFLLH